MITNIPKVKIYLASTLLIIANGAAAIDISDNDYSTAEATMRNTAEWLLEEHDGLPNGARRAIVLTREYVGAPTVINYSVYGLNNTAACKSLEFLSLYAQYHADTKILVNGHTERHRIRVGIRRLVDLILSLRSNDTTKIYYGAINGGTSNVYATMPNAVCGHALLLASRVMNEPTWRDVAVGIGDFLLRMQNPGPYYTDRVDFSGRSMEDGIFDHVYPTEVIETNMSTWNLLAAPFLEEIYAETGAIGYHYGAVKTARGLATGALNGYDYYAVGGLPCDNPWLRKAKSYTYVDQAFADGLWHRQGEVAPTNEGRATAGTDGTEYGLAALNEYGYEKSALASSYKALRDMPNPSEPALDMGISFSGFFRMCLWDIQCPEPVNYGNYYDTVGFGILAEFKRDMESQDSSIARDANETFRALLLGRSVGTMANSDFDPIWSTEGKCGTESTHYQCRTDGVLPAATNATALLKLVNDL